MNRFVEDGHDTDLFLEVFFGFAFFIELRVGTGKRHLHVDESPGHEDLIGKTDDFQEHPRDENEDEDIDDIFRYVEDSIPECGKHSFLLLTTRRHSCLYGKGFP